MRLHHVGVAVVEVDQAITFYRDAFSMDLVKGPLDDPIQGVTACLLRGPMTETFFELVAPYGPDSPVEGVLRRGGGMYHACFETQDVERDMDELVSLGSLLLSPPKEALLFDSRKVGWLYAPARHVIELLEGPDA